MLAVLAAVVLPFGGFAYFVDAAMAERALEVVREALLGLASDLSKEVDTFLLERRRDLEEWAADPTALAALVEAQAQVEADPNGASTGTPLGAWSGTATTTGDWAKRSVHMSALNRRLKNRGFYDRLVLVNRSGRAVVCGGLRPDGSALSQADFERVAGFDFRSESWFERAWQQDSILIDHHRSALVAGEADAAQGAPSYDDYHVGVAARIVDEDGAARGLLLGIVNWTHFVALMRDPLVKATFRGMVSRDATPSPYAWIWGADADTILAHPLESAFLTRVSGPVINLPGLVEDARAGSRGVPALYREYSFNGIAKNAAFQGCRDVSQGGLGWYVGVGIDNSDIFATTRSLDEVLYKGTAVVLLVVVLWTLVIARRTTGPILALQRHTQRLAREGEDVEPLQIHSRDELGELAQAFNTMTRELAEKKRALVKAEKDAAWNEMARQIAHEIKNPLTPIKLSLDLLQRARREGRADLDEILDRTMRLIDRQVTNLRDIARDFYEFTGGREPEPQPLGLQGCVAEVLGLHAAWADELGVQFVTELDPDHCEVWADRGKWQSVLTNLVTNALQAMAHGEKKGGELCIRSAAGERPGTVAIEVRDTGVGLSDEARERLFEPFFTTRSEGTGLGLAIVRRTLEEMRGSIELSEREDGPGTVARIELPAKREAQ